MEDNISDAFLLAMRRTYMDLLTRRRAIWVSDGEGRWYSMYTEDAHLLFLSRFPENIQRGIAGRIVKQGTSELEAKLAAKALSKLSEPELSELLDGLEEIQEGKKDAWPKSEDA